MHELLNDKVESRARVETYTNHRFFEFEYLERGVGDLGSGTRRMRQASDVRKHRARAKLFAVLAP